MKSLYPEIESLHQYALTTGAHRVYFEESGNPTGLPVIFLHGGPGSGCNPNHRRYFDPQKYRVVIFDQRGCHRSSPEGCIENNTTRDLLLDMEAIRLKLGIERWLVFGGSWGAALALLYAEAHPARVAGLVLRGTFLARQRDLDWFVKDGVNRIFPDYWTRFTDTVPVDKRHDLIAAYYYVLHGDNNQARINYARAWSAWSGKVVTYAAQEMQSEEEDINKLVNQVSIETHYAFNRYFIKENQILDNIAQVPDVPIMIIHGRRDLTCTLETSWSLHKALPHAELMIVPDGGHLAGEPAMVDALVRATDSMAGILT